MISKELQNMKKEYNVLLNRLNNADIWFSKQDNSYFDNVERKKEYRALVSILSKLCKLHTDIKKLEQ